MLTDFKQLSEVAAIRSLQKCDVAYHKGKPLISDAIYDKLYAHAKAKFKHNAYFASVGASVPVKASKVKLPVLVGSLDKTRPADAQAFYKSVEAKSGKQQAWYTTPKLDGQSVLLKYVDGKFVQAITRGDGMVGRDITAAAKHIQGVISSYRKNKLYSKIKTLYVRGEVIMHNSIFKKYYSNEQLYKTPRNLVVGLTNRIDVAGSAQDLKRCTFIAYHAYAVVNGTPIRPTSKHRELLYLSMMGFTTITNPSRYSEGHFKLLKSAKNGHKNLKRLLPVHKDSGGLGNLIVWSTKPTEQELVETYRKMRNLVDIDIDGIVLDPLDITYWNKKKYSEARPEHSCAIKLDVHDQDSAIGIIKRVDFEISKRGLLKPVVVLKSALNLGGVDVTNITANNARFVSSWGLKPGAKVKVIRSGDVIPRIVSVYNGKIWRKVDIKAQTNNTDKPIAFCPACKTKLVWNPNKTDLLCSNIKCEGREGKQRTSFFATLGVENVAGGTITQLVDAGFDTIEKLLTADKAKLAKIPGFGTSKAATAEKELRNALVDKPLSKIMHASNIFSNSQFSLGSTRLADILDAIEAKKLDVSTSDVERIGKAIAVTKGLGNAGYNLFMSKLPQWRAFYAKIAKHHRVNKVSATGKNIRVAFTGWRDSKLEQHIISRGGRVGGVTKDTTVLFAASMGSTKAKKAQSLGITIIPQSQAWEWANKHVK